MSRSRRPRASTWLARTGVRRGARAGAALSVFLLLLSGLSINALTAGIDIAPTAIGPPEHRFADDGEDLDPEEEPRKGAIPAAAFERFNPSCPPAVSSSQARISASGGAEVVDVEIGGVVYRQHRFTSDGTFTVSAAAPAARVEVLVVGGGGGGGKRHGGGGGAGGLVLATVPVSTDESFAVVVGGGGNGAGEGSTPTQGKSGEDSTFVAGAKQVLARGGGYGGRFSNESVDEKAGDGGSGGGARSRNGVVGQQFGSSTQSSVANRCATINAGNPGGVASGSWPGGGGGGAGGAGGPADASASPPSQVGGPGLDLSGRFGVDVGDDGWFAGGGGGAPAAGVGTTLAQAGSIPGGKGGGGAGAGGDAPGVDGTIGTGGGGGGARSSDEGAMVTGGRGGDGIVIVRYPVVPGPVREAVAGEARATKLSALRWRVPFVDAPSADASYLIERRPISGTAQWQEVTGATFESTGSGADRVIEARFTSVGEDHNEFRVTPMIGTVKGEPIVVASVGKGGDDIRFIGTDVVHGFTSPGGATFALSEARSLRYLIVGGGGGGGSRHGGGGGAGGLLTNVDDAVGLAVSAADPQQVIVGAGGGGADAGSITIGSKGQDSSAFGETAFGGGAGSSLRAFDALQNGGSGGGARGNFEYDGGTGTNGQGFRGGAVGATGGQMRGGGGGGANGVGQAGRNGSGNGGPGRDLSGDFGTTFGVSGVFAGGGGGSGDSTDGGSQSSGGAGGGGSGGHGGSPGQAGAPGSGGGGGGGGHSSSANRDGYPGGSGIVIVRYPFLDSGVQGGVFAATATSAVLRWEEPAVGSGTITGYRIERSDDGGATWATDDVTPTSNGTVRTVELSIPFPNPQRRFRVTALHGQMIGSVTELAVVGRGGDTVTLAGDDVVHQFTTVGPRNFELATDRTVEYLVVGGGGGGGYGYDSGPGGGGGAGGFVNSSTTLGVAAYQVKVGAGGPGGTGSNNAKGEDSVFGEVIAWGGGAGGPSRAAGGDGGSGGGGGGRHISPAGAAGKAQGPPPQGHDGVRSPGGTGAGGGGGSGGTPAEPTTNVGGNGGPGSMSTISGATVTYASGGAGGSRLAQQDGAAGETNRGAGGSGASSNQSGSRNGGPGGSGVVVIRYSLAK